MKNRFPFTCGICIRPSHSRQNAGREVIEYLQKRLAREGFLFFWSLPRNIHIPGSEERNRISQGKYALPHALLRRDEIEEELLLPRSRRNDALLEYLFPPCPAPFRKGLRSIYLKRGRLFLEDRNRLLYFDSRQTIRFPLLHMVGTEEYPSLKRRMKQVKRLVQTERIPAFIVLDAGSTKDAEAAVSLLVRLRRKFRCDVLELEDLLNMAGSTRESATAPEELLLSKSPNPPLPADPLSRSRREIAWDKPKETRLLLLSRAFETDKAEEKRECGTLPVPERGLIAHMPGEVEMDEEDVAASFSHGELAGLSRGGTTGFIHAPSASWIETSGNLVRSRRIGSFSFQNSSIRGLRDSSVFESGEFLEPGRLVRDYFFAAGDPRLCISFFLFFPRCRPGVEIRSYGVCEIPFRSARGYPVGEVHYPDEGASPVPLDSASEGLLHGTAFSFKDETTTLSLVFADHQAKVRELPFKVNDGELCINPGGSYLGFPGKKLEGLQERFSIVLSLDPLSPENPPLRSLASLLPHLESHQICRETRQEKVRSV
ncbi:hypothetical protein [Marispirochaeta aestuarii]|uniref:hypothetical protein n=1 Tax=Marispirochaeta aestuarii TaxID=1963862 RepID=UPI002ABE33DE|nr:hypothetical protein [Marispirochaeta aestuarii]